MQQLTGVRVAIASSSESARKILPAAFTQRGAKIVICSDLDYAFVDKCQQPNIADIVLLEVGDDYDINEEVLDLLLDQIDLPVLFHENTTEQSKKSSLGEYYSEQQIEVLAVKIAGQVTIQTHQQDIVDVSESKLPVHTPASSYAVNTWTLGASTGGPEAVQSFLSLLPAKLPVAFVLAQHLGEQFIPLLAEQLDRHTQFKVKVAHQGDSLRHGKVLVAPTDKRIKFNEMGVVSFHPQNWKGHYRPSIDCVINDVYNRYKERSGVIIFSGMGADGVLASQRFHDEYQGAIWAQNADSCVISSMPDALRKSNLASISASPRELAAKITERYMGKIN